MDEANNLEALHVQVAEQYQMIKRCNGRIEKLEARQDNLDSIAASVTALATEQDYIKTDVKEIKSDVKSLTAKPGKRWEGIVDKIIYIVVGALVAWALSHFGL